MRLREYREEDFEPLLELFNRHQLAAFGEADATADEFRTWLTTPYVTVSDDIRVLEDEGHVVGYADVDPTREDPPHWWCDVKVDPEANVDEVVPLLVGWLDERAAAEGGTIRVWSSDTDARLTDAFRALRFEPARHSFRMEIDLDGERRRPDWPGGIEVRTVRDGEHERVYGAVCEAWQDTNDPMDETFAEWAHWMMREGSFDPGLWFLAFAGDELAGFSLCSRVDDRSERRLRRQPRRSAAVAAAGAGRGAAPPFVRGVPGAGLDARDARRRRVQQDGRDEALRARRHARLPRHRFSRTPRAGVGLSA